MLVGREARRFGDITTGRCVGVQRDLTDRQISARNVDDDSGAAASARAAVVYDSHLLISFQVGAMMGRTRVLCFSVSVLLLRTPVRKMIVGFPFGKSPKKFATPNTSRGVAYESQGMYSASTPNFSGLRVTAAMEQTFGTRIKALRTEAKLTLDQLAKLSNSSKSYIWELENKNPPRPSAEKMAEIAKALHVTTDYLLGNEDETVAEDKAFFRKYSKMSEATRRQIRAIAETLNSMPSKDDD